MRAEGSIKKEVNNEQTDQRRKDQVLKSFVSISKFNKIILKGFGIHFPVFPGFQICSRIEDYIINRLDVFNDNKTIVVRSGIKQDFNSRAQIYRFNLLDFGVFAPRQKNTGNQKKDDDGFLHFLMFLCCQVVALSASLLAASMA